MTAIITTKFISIHSFEINVFHKKSHSNIQFTGSCIEFEV
jgi:hypothetical protein